ncbi:hypothetical protein [Yeosuana sp. AK3]
MKLYKLNPDSIKKSIICKHVSSNLINKTIKKTHKPKAGDVAIFKVKAIGKHTRMQCVDGNSRFILEDDYIMAAFGNRYATEQMEGKIPDTYQTTYHVLGQGGAIGVIKNIHQKFELVGPTTLSLVGYIVDDQGVVINTKNIHNMFESYKLSKQNNPKIILSLGTSMDSGKTTSAAFLANGLKKANKKVAYIKLTGTVFTKDKNFVRDYGADVCVDFSDFGFPSTYMCSNNELKELLSNTLKYVNQFSTEFIIMEIADGLLQRETWNLIHNKTISENVFGVIFSSMDSMSAISGAKLLSDLNFNVIGVTGLFTTSPLLINEVQLKSHYTVLTKEELTSKKIVETLHNKLSIVRDENKMAVNI